VDWAPELELDLLHGWEIVSVATLADSFELVCKESAAGHFERLRKGLPKCAR
jgi:hypothetical protein